MPGVPDYDALARSLGGSAGGGAAAVDYDALAGEYGGQPGGPERPLAGATGIGPTPWYDQGMALGRGPSVRDALNWLPAAGGAIGGVLGGAGGTAFGLGIGGAPGAMGGAGLGSGAGEAAKQLAQRALGVKAPDTSAEAAADIGTQAAVGAASEGVGRVAVPIIGRGVKALLPAPEKQYAQALGATTVQNKQLSEKVVTELIKRRVHGSREALAELSEAELGKAGLALDDALAAVPKGTAADAGAVLEHLHQLKRGYVVPSGTPGVNNIVDKAAYDNLTKLQKIVASTEPTFESMRRLRQILDGKVTAGDKTFGRTIAEGSELDATREAASAIRRELAKVAPDVAKINKEYSFWSNVDRVVNATIARTSSQATPLGQQLAQATATPAVVAGVAFGGPGGAAAAGTASLVALRRLTQSPQWKTWSAVQKSKLADAIASGDAQQISALLAHGGRGAADVHSGRVDRP